MRTFSILSAIVVGIVFPILFLDYSFDNGFLQKFMETESLAIMGNMLAIYVGVVTAFMVILDNIQKEFDVPCIRTQKKLRDNILTMLILYGLQIVLLVAIPKNYNSILWVEYCIKGLEVLFFALYFLLFYEVIDVFFTARKIAHSNESTNHSK